MSRPLLLALVILSLTFAAPLRAIVLLHQIPADGSFEPYAIERQGNSLFVAAGDAGLVVFDATNVRAAVQVGTASVGAPVFHVSVSKSLAAVAGPTGVTLLEVSDRAMPRPLWHLPLDRGNAVRLEDDRLYVSWESGSGPEQIHSGLRIYDVADPLAPIPIGEWSVQEFLGGFDVRGRRVAFSSYQIEGEYVGRLRILDAQADSTPIEVGRFEASGNFQAPALVGTRVFLPIGRGPYDGTPGLRILETSAGPDPVQLGIWAAPHLDPIQVEVRDGVAALGTLAGGIVLVDVSDPHAPTPRGEFAISAGFHSASFDGAYLHVASNDGGLQTLSLVDLDHPNRRGRVEFPAEAGPNAEYEPRGLAVEGTDAFATTGTRTLRIVDLSDPSVPVLRGLARLPGTHATDVVALGAHVFVTWRGSNDRGGIQVFDVSDPDAPTLVGQLADLGGCLRVVRSGHILVVASAGSVHLIDVSIPNAPRLRASGSIPSRLKALSVANSRVYIGWQSDWLPWDLGTSVADIANADAPSPRPSLPFILQDIALRIDTTLLAKDSELSIVPNASDPAATPLASFAVPSERVIDAGRMMDMTGDGALRVLDLPSPEALRVLGGVAARPDFDRLGEARVTLERNGLSVFDFGAEYTVSDRDGDGRLDAIDACPELAVGEDVDTDRDGLGDPCDPTPVPEPDAEGAGLAIIVLALLRWMWRPR